MSIMANDDLDRSILNQLWANGSADAVDLSIVFGTYEPYVFLERLRYLEHCKFIRYDRLAGACEVTDPELVPYRIRFLR